MSGNTLNIDIETFSSVDIGKSGLYKYVQSPDFEVMLFAFSLNGGAVEVIDLAQGEGLPLWLIEAMFDPNYIKHAYNAAFEIACLSRHFGRPLPTEQWRCTMLHGLYCGYPAGLDAIGQALGLPEDKKKLVTGKALIKHFCVPCAPSKANGGRTRNLPKHDLDKWHLFKIYNRQDVVTEMEIAKRLSEFPVPDEIERQWRTDLAINSRGVALDMQLVQGALAIDSENTEKLLTEASELTGLANPNSLAQLRTWFKNEAGFVIEDFQAETIKELLMGKGNGNMVEGKARRMLEIRQELSKTSVKKYAAMSDVACQDNRARGLLQFYGANRTGRWAGRLIQVQNLYRSQLSVAQSEIARETVKHEQSKKLQLLFGRVPETLAQLVRTAFVASPGHVLIDADFSAIEARVIAWLAGEQWRLDVFKGDGKIYEASAAMMFNVPIEKIKKGNPEYALRQKGKIAELALGYQGGVNALKAMGADKMGLSDQELQDILKRWRSASPAIVSLWQDIETAAREIINKNESSITLNKLEISCAPGPFEGMYFMTIKLPSGRKLYYPEPEITYNRWKEPAISYMGMNQTSKKWCRQETYGGKLVENCVQAIARDCLAEAIERLEAAGYPVVFHVHDEVVIDCPEDKADLNKVIEIMTEPMPWAPDLVLKADGWTGQFFRKE